MKGTDIGQALIDQRGFCSIAETDLVTSDLSDLTRFEFVGVRQYWGSMLTCGVLVIQDEDMATVEQCSQEFHAFSSSLRPHAGEIVGTRLGAFGLLLVLFDGPASSMFQRFVRSQKRGSARKQDYCLTWLMDVARCDVVRHAGLPFTMFPGRRFFLDILNAKVNRAIG